MTEYPGHLVLVQQPRIEARATGADGKVLHFQLYINGEFVKDYSDHGYGLTRIWPEQRLADWIAAVHAWDNEGFRASRWA